MLYGLAFTAGLLLTLQVGVNATLRQSLGSPATAALANFVVGLIGLLVFLLATRPGWPTRAAMAGAPAWAWVGGLCGAFYVATAIVVGPRLGASALLALTVLGQLLASLTVDNFGWLGFAQQPLTLARVAGAALLFLGVLLIVRAPA